MPYVESNYCFPYEVKRINIGDIVVIKPATIKSNGKVIVIPPLSLISNNCNRPLDSTFWIDGVKIKGKEVVRLYDGDFEVNGKIDVLSPEFLPGYTLQKILDDVRLRIRIYNDGVPILSINDYPLVLVKNNEVIINTSDYPILFRLVGYSIYYYISSEYSEEI
ncbi:hypothetical protein DFR86_09820 [Acidianus sulfidivorans JP7]|uniref:Uncharacterized protein n=1 Tax=Acidianus sulfidivorans JP7 TaxID=619593 RepID=A0A2U9IP75_9CREN|nr:hypothetical protein [Acidianus sulfidivorans]AWR97812.1 hypothetical protein DFR86_09820 [Acidianus sulfidivorans JP7]